MERSRTTAILIDPPRWPAHGTVFGHLVSDASLDELIDFAESTGLPSRAFDHDHYDVPEARYPELIAAGATQVPERELIIRLIGSGLRVRTGSRTPTRAAALERLGTAWTRTGVPDDVRDDLLRRWGEPHRHYHDVRHLTQCLEALDTLGGATRPTLVAAWFHDAVYEGAPSDEERSALFAEQRLGALLSPDEVSTIAALVRMTMQHRPDGAQAALLSDADLSILGQVRGRYLVYLRDVRLDYAHLTNGQWRDGRQKVVRALLDTERLFHTDKGHHLWERAARANLGAELIRLQRVEHHAQFGE